MANDELPWNCVTHAINTIFNFNSRRSVVYGTHGIVVSAQPLACEAGLEILRKGGNAADAAVATAAALNVTQPQSCGIGGDCFALYFDAKTKKVSALNGTGRSPKALTLEKVRQMGITGKEIPYNNLNAVTVPGAIDGFIDTLKLFGSGRVSLAEVLAPAIRLAEEGYPVSEITAHEWACYEESIKQASNNGNDMLRNGKAPQTGDIMKMPYLSKTFREIADKGRDGFYRGPVAEAIIELIQSKGGVMTLDDLAEHTSTPVEPISISYGEHDGKCIRLWECPPNGQGIVALMAIGILEEMQKQHKIPPLETLEHNSAEYIHALVEALRLAFVDACFFVTDPDVEHVPVEQLLSRPYLAKRAESFDPKAANKKIKHARPVNSSDTVYFAVTDPEGNACSFISSLFTPSYGTAAVPKNCGFTLNSRGSEFILEEGHPNCLAGGKRPYHSVIPAMVTRENGELIACYGVMGGYMQPQGHVQVLMNMFHHRFSIQAALDVARFCIGVSVSEDPNKNINSELFLEDGICDEVVEKLKSMGHDVKLVKGYERCMFGRGHIIATVPNTEKRSVWAAGSDPRGDGHAAGW
jgi:gamma-glutamyltranspeptidase/glutathione hydrolase